MWISGFGSKAVKYFADAGAPGFETNYPPEGKAEVKRIGETAHER